MEDLICLLATVPTLKAATGATLPQAKEKYKHFKKRYVKQVTYKKSYFHLDTDILLKVKQPAGRSRRYSATW